MIDGAVHTEVVPETQNLARAPNALGAQPRTLGTSTHIANDTLTEVLRGAGCTWFTGQLGNRWVEQHRRIRCLQAFPDGARLRVMRWSDQRRRVERRLP
jgi:hypothetical protein